MESIKLTEAALHRYDAAVIVTDHSLYNWEWIVDHSALVVDTRNATRVLGKRDNIKRL
jgi:UDP-N-acetyl-D-glucosamine dehydrogenase